MKMVCGGLPEEAGFSNCFSQGGGDCEGCDGTGIRCPAEPSCVLSNLPRGWVVVERCDYCEQYPDDLVAAHVLCEVVTRIRCAEGGLHAVGRLAKV
jgi:hypothetical protein